MNMGSRANEQAVVIVGAGAAGLACARALVAHGVVPLVLEAGDGVGGRVRTDVHPDGFLLDRGFQVLLTSYPAVRALVDLRDLQLAAFAPGALVARGGRLLTVSDPVRRPRDAWRTLAAPVGTLTDKLRVAALRLEVSRGSMDALFQAPETSTAAHLEDLGFSRVMRDRFFAPFLGGVMLDPDLSTSSRMFRFVMRMFAAGDIALPARGMGALMGAIAAPLPSGTVRLGARVARVEPGCVRLENGEELRARRVVVAVEGASAARLLGHEAPPSRGTTCVYFETRTPVVDGPWLVLNGERSERAALLNHAAVLSNVAPSYAPRGRSLLSASVLGIPDSTDAALVDALRADLIAWFGERAEGARALQVVRVPHALPLFVPPTAAAAQPARMQDGIVVVGDHRATPSLQGALQSGIDAARAILAQGWHRGSIL